MSSESKKMANEVFDGTVADAWDRYWKTVALAQKVYRQVIEAAGIDYRLAEEAAREDRIKAIAAAKGLYDAAGCHG